MSLERVQPNNIDAERAVLGAMLLPGEGKAAIAKVVKILGDNSFYKTSHQEIYLAVKRLFERSEAVDLLTVTKELSSVDKLEMVGGVTYIDEMIDSVPTAANVEYYANMVKDCALRRRLIRTSYKIYNNAFLETEELSDLLSASKQSIYEIQEDNSIRRVSISDELEKIMFKLGDGAIAGIPTGFREIDKLTCGYMDGEFYIIGGRPRMGKTALMLKLITKLCDIPKKVMLVSIEMPIEQILLRLLSMICQIPYRCFRSDHEFAESLMPNIMNGANLINSWPLVIDDAPSAPIEQIVAKIENIYFQEGLDIVFIDHMHLIPISKWRNGNEAYTAISLALKSLARRLNIPVVCLAQLSRGLEYRKNKRPMLADLRESGSLEQNADHVWFVHNPIEYENTEFKPSIQDVELIIAKNKSLETGIVNLTFKGSYMEFKE